MIERQQPEKRRRYRLLAWPIKHTAMLCTPDGAREFGVVVLPDDDLIVLYRPGISEMALAWFIAALRADGHEVIVTDRMSDKQRSLDRWADDGGRSE